MRFIPTKVHGALDYGTVALLLALPRALGWSGKVTALLNGAALGTLVYSLVTRYEWGVVPKLPMRSHLALDGLSGALLAASPLLFADEDSTVKAALVGLGAFEIAASLLSKSEKGDTTLAPAPTQEPLGELNREAAARR